MNLPCFETCRSCCCSHDAHCDGLSVLRCRSKVGVQIRMGDNDVQNAPKKADFRYPLGCGAAGGVHQLLMITADFGLSIWPLNTIGSVICAWGSTLSRKMPDQQAPDAVSQPPETPGWLCSGREQWGSS